MTKSEETAKKAASLARDGETISALEKLIDYADRGVNNRKTEYIFKSAVEKEFADLEFQVAEEDR